MKANPKRQRFFLILFVLIGLGVAILILRQPSARPTTPRIQKVENDLKKAKQRYDQRIADAKNQQPDPDVELVRNILAEKLASRTFSFATVCQAVSGKKVIPLDQSPAGQKVVEAINVALSEILPQLSQADSPVRQLRRINEASRFFEDALLQKLNSTAGLNCEIPPTRDGVHQRSGYPDLRIEDEATGAIFYLDPKLVEQGSAGSTFRSFYFEPKIETLKVNDDAVHLLVGIEHDGKTGAWTFSGWRIVDLSTLQVRLKAEFQASNAELYRETELSLPADKH
ncbi:hypothetical protein JIN85_02040 [Luteolibacter pohnpeiensis]|uniref:Uncharacterized protein n=1 Tax=Luteolibacter pohnpeiensis TaxID=454153 RepID=A0A934S4U8_9BACT|nr:hypothetical protein [Luteolibacter pohnpeiensis]MBK1881174.1 hypothetical protein [Luteolibacter pohnpeiensis]